LHDYGKIGIPDSILKKEGKLSDEEYEIMKEHAISTYNILSRVHFSEEMTKLPLIAAMHHERWDGNGYPFSKKEKEIPLEARIIAVADVFDGMTSWREYHDPWSVQTAVDEIKEGNGTRFDPDVVSAFIRLVDAGNLVSSVNSENKNG
jgi:HD-GYP domain-containing protein (c-di-GMP phosphodiesterase class II)